MRVYQGLWKALQQKIKNKNKKIKRFNLILLQNHFSLYDNN